MSRSAPREGDALLQDGRPVGRLTTVVESEGGHRALGYVRHGLARAGVALEVAGGGRAEVLG